VNKKTTGIPRRNMQTVVVTLLNGQLFTDMKKWSFPTLVCQWPVVWHCWGLIADIGGCRLEDVTLQ